MAPRPPKNIPEFTEVDYKTKAGVAWSHNYLNQKPWHPMSYPNQRRKWIAEQEHAVRETQREVAAKEFAEEQEFFKEAALLSESERKRIELAQAVSFMYQRPPGYNPDIDVIKKSEKPEEQAEEPKKARVKDVFGRSIATGEEFEALKDAPKLETGIVGKAKPFAVEIRNVKCARCGAFGHQSGDRDCPLRDTMMPGEAERQKREDPLQKILAQVPQEAPKWTLKDGGRSPPRGGFASTAENQQILPPDEVELQMAAQADASGAALQQIDESVLAQLSKSERKALLRAYGNSDGAAEKLSKEKKKRRKHRRKRQASSDSSEESSDDSVVERKKERERGRRKRNGTESETESETERKRKRNGREAEPERVETERKERKRNGKETETQRDEREQNERKRNGREADTKWKGRERKRNRNRMEGSSEDGTSSESDAGKDRQRKRRGKDNESGEKRGRQVEVETRKSEKRRRGQSADSDGDRGVGVQDIRTEEGVRRKENGTRKGEKNRRVWNDSGRLNDDVRRKENEIRKGKERGRGRSEAETRKGEKRERDRGKNGRKDEGQRENGGHAKTVVADAPRGTKVDSDGSSDEPERGEGRGRHERREDRKRPMGENGRQREKQQNHGEGGENFAEEDGGRHGRWGDSDSGEGGDEKWPREGGNAERGRVQDFESEERREGRGDERVLERNDRRVRSRVEKDGGEGTSDHRTEERDV